MDPAVVARLGDPTQQTNVIIEIDAPSTRLFTGFPGTLTVAGKTYAFRELRVDPIAETADGSSRLKVALTLADADNGVTDLVNDPNNRNAPIIITKVHFNQDWTIAGTEPWFEGFTGQPKIVGSWVQLTAIADMGRTGPSPRTTMKQALVSHTPPAADQKFVYTSYY